MDRLRLHGYILPRAAVAPGITHICMLLMLFVVFCLGSAPVLAKNNAGNSCSKTADAAFKACQHEVRDDYWIAIGNCNNLSDPDARAECEQEAKDALSEGKGECGEQKDARLELCQVLGEAPYDPEIDPAMFVDPADIGNGVAANPYFPLIRGRIWIYENDTETVTVTVTDETREILGVTCAVVHDVVEEDGEVIEDTKDWFAQDTVGNVWYFGEIAMDFEDGELVSIDGSWTAGMDGAKAGFIMKVAPAVGEVYRQEFSLGNAEDVAEVLSLTGSADVPATSCDGDCLITKDFTPLEPDAVEHKYYKPNTGLILEVNPETGERLELVEIQP